MRTHFPLLLLASLLTPACGSDDAAERGPAAVETLATDSLAAGWRPIDPPRKYQDDALFDYFAGDAAIYREYGCRQV
ncbi:MAG: hypothetical protein JXQ29_17855, partial [Planctomycetes bacterium]|nr:hypothetical protein [Planctomycetota bacterium]